MYFGNKMSKKGGNGVARGQRPFGLFPTKKTYTLAETYVPQSLTSLLERLVTLKRGGHFQSKNFHYKYMLTNIYDKRLQRQIPK